MTLGQSVIVAAMILLVAVFCVFMVFKRSGTREKQFVRVAVENIPDFKSGIISRHHFDKQLAARDSEGRFSRRECTMIQFRFRSGETGVSEAVIEMLVQHLREWPITREFYITKLSESGFAVLIEGVALPDDVQMLEDRLRMHLELPLGAGQTKGVEYILASASFPYDTREVSELWGVVAKRLALRKKPMERDSVRPQVSLLESGIIRVDYGMAEGVTYELMREAFQVYQDEIAPDYPGVKFPQLTVAGRMVSLDPKAIQFTRSKMLVDVTTAIAVPPKGHIEKHIMRMFSYYNQPPYPFRICDTEDEAAEWLSNYVDPMFWQIKQQKKTA